jgi:hypothetical protein
VPAARCGLPVDCCLLPATCCLLPASLPGCLLACLPASAAAGWLAGWLAGCLAVWLAACLFGCLAGWPPACLPACLTACLSACLPACLPACCLLAAACYRRLLPAGCCLLPAGCCRWLFTTFVVSFRDLSFWPEAGCEAPGHSHTPRVFKMQFVTGELAAASGACAFFPIIPPRHAPLDPSLRTALP